MGQVAKGSILNKNAIRAFGESVAKLFLSDFAGNGFQGSRRGSGRGLFRSDSPRFRCQLPVAKAIMKIDK